jgi:hypothetical protein
MQIEPTFNYYINTFDVIPSDNGLTNVISKINIVIVATHSYFTESSFYTISLGPPSESSFISYESLTQEIVQGWINECQDSIFVAKKLELTNKLTEQATKPIITIKPPF